MSTWIRIIGGQWRSRKIAVLEQDGLRPTTDRIRETLFNWLMPVVRDAHCLDLFAGSGALGFEALSRGAASVDFIEYSSIVARQLQKNREHLQAYSGSIHVQNALNYLEGEPTKPFDLVFIDPPFHHQLADQAIAKLAQKEWLSNRAMIYVETEVGCTLSAIPSTWHLYREKQTKQLQAQLFIKES